ncbi:MAG: hypothetical protein JO097_02275 [Acidobacteriaceae bacterium]|nr:hypothetical protein [Acidobacteriaceae bacterium]
MKNTQGGFAVLGWLVMLLLMLVSVGRHPASLGSGLFLIDITLLSGYGVFSLWGWRQQRADVRDALTAGARMGIILGLVLVASHLVEWLGLDRSRTAQFARGAGSTLLILGLLGAAGSAAWQRTRSIRLGAIAGLWSASLAMVILLNFALSLNLAFETHSIAWLHEAVAASGMRDAGAFVVRNSLEAASEILIRLGIGGLVLSLMGSLLSAWIMPRSRNVSMLAAWLMPFVFVAGVISLWYAGSLERSARPPFVMAGVLAAGFAVCGAHPIWSCFFRRRATESALSSTPA